MKKMTKKEFEIKVKEIFSLIPSENICVQFGDGTMDVYIGKIRYGVIFKIKNKKQREQMMEMGIDRLQKDKEKIIKEYNKLYK